MVGKSKPVSQWQAQHDQLQFECITHHKKSLPRVKMCIDGLLHECVSHCFPACPCPAAECSAECGDGGRARDGQPGSSCCHQAAGSEAESGQCPAHGQPLRGGITNQGGLHRPRQSLLEGDDSQRKRTCAATERGVLNSS